MRIFPQEVRRLDKVVNARVVATTEDYAKINQFEMAAGPVPGRRRGPGR